MRFVSMCLFLLLSAAPAMAEDDPASAPDAAPAPEPKWEFMVAPYIWFIGIDGSIDAAGHSADVNVTFSDIWDALDMTALVAAEARRGRFSFATNLIYLRISSSASHPTGAGLPIADPGSFSVRDTMNQLIWEFRPAWEVLSLPLFSEKHRIALDLGPGARFMWMATHLDVKLDPAVPGGPFQRRFDERIDFVDWLAAGRIRAQLTDDIGLVVSGDYGGFGIGSSSHETWSIAAFASYRLGDTFDLSAGWRQISIDHGPADLDISGPLVGLAMHF